MDFLGTLKNLFTPKQQPTSTNFGSFMSNYTQPKAQPKAQPTGNSTNWQPPKPPVVPKLPESKFNIGVVGGGELNQTPQAIANRTAPDLTLSTTTLNQQPYDIQQPSTMANDGLGATANSYFTESTKSSPRETALSKQMELIGKYGEQGQFTQDLMKEQQMAEKQQYLTNLNTKALTTKRAYEKQIEEMRKNPRGQSEFGLTSDINELSRKANQELADIAIQQQAAQGNVDTATNIINQAVAAKFEPIKNEIEARKSWFEMYSNDMTEREKREYDSITKQFELQYESEAKNAELEKKASMYQPLLDNGTYTLKDIPEDVRFYMNTSGYVSPEQKVAKEQTQQFMGKVDQFMKLGGTGAVGPLATRIAPAILSAFGITNYQKDKSLVQNIKAQLTLSNLNYLKGAMSDKDILFITQASSALNENMTEKQFKSELVNIQRKFVNGIVNSPAFSVDEKKEALMKQFILEDPKATDEQISEMTNAVLSTASPTFSSVGKTSASTRPQRNNNPLNIKSSDFTNKFSGVSGVDPTPATDGGKFLTFNSPQAGFEAAKKLITAPSYSQLSVDKALKRWSGNGYGAEIVPTLKNKTIAQLSASELNTLIQTMAKREGYYA